MQVFQLLVLAIPYSSAGHCPVPGDWNHWPDIGCGLYLGVARVSVGAPAEWLCAGQEQHPPLVHWWLLGPAHVIPPECY